MAEQQTTLISESQKVAALHSAVEQSNRETEGKINLQYEAPQENADNVLFYHNRPHTRGVIGRGDAIARAVHNVSPKEVTESDIEAVRLGAGKHDEIQLWHPIEVVIKDSEGKELGTLVKRQRETGENERLSAGSLLKFTEELPQGLLQPKQADAALAGILLTTPGWDSVHKTVVQPGFADAPFIAQAIALADLAGSGMQGADLAVYEAAALLWEEFISIRQYRDTIFLEQPIRRVRRVDELAQEDFYKAQMLDWFDRQVDFIRGRQALVWGEIDSLNVSEEGRVAVKKLFSNQKFDAAVASIQEVREDLAQKTFIDCAKKIDNILAHVPEGI